MLSTLFTEIKNGNKRGIEKREYCKEKGH